MKLSKLSDSSKISMYDYLGKLVLIESIPAGLKTLSITTNHLPAGAYVIKWESSTGLKSMTVIKF